MTFFVLHALARSLVLNADEKTFQSLIINGEKETPWFVMFTTDTCPACAQATPEFELASEKSRGFARFAVANTRKCPNIAKSFGVRAVPSFFLFTATGTSQYQGSRTSGSFLQFISEAIGDGIEEVDETWLDSHDNRVILFTRRFKPPALFSAAYGAFKTKNIRFGMVRDTETIELFGNPNVPSILMCKSTGEREIYTGKHEYIPLIDSISEYFGIDLDDGDL